MFKSFSQFRLQSVFSLDIILLLVFSIFCILELIFNLYQRKYAYAANIIVGTPGRVMDLMEPKKDKVGLDLGNVDHFILDEADRLLDQGFADDMYKIHKEIVRQRFDSFIS